MRWREAMELSLYGADGFFTRSGAGDSAGVGPIGHFRTSAHASPIFAAALAQLVVRVDDALDRPSRLDVVDVGAGRAELLVGLLSSLPAEVATRVRVTAVELAPRPADLMPEIHWVTEPPPATVGLLLATEWLDNVPLDVVTLDECGQLRYVLVDPEGDESLGPPVEAADAEWLARWWPLAPPPGVAAQAAPPPGVAAQAAEPPAAAAAYASRAEVGAARDAAWAAAVSTVERGLALTVDYGHLRGGRPVFGTLTAFRAGRRVYPVPDGSCDLTAHVALDSVAEAGAAAGGVPPLLLSQRAALQALGVSGERPPWDLAKQNPAGFVRRLAEASVAAELIDPDGLGGHYWLLQPVRLDIRTLGMTNRHTER